MTINKKKITLLTDIIDRIENILMLKYMLARCLVFGFNGGITQELIEIGVNAITYGLEDQEKLRDAIQNFKGYQRIIVYTHESEVKKFSFSSSVKKVFNYYEKGQR